MNICIYNIHKPIYTIPNYIISLIVIYLVRSNLADRHCLALYKRIYEFANGLNCPFPLTKGIIYLFTVRGADHYPFLIRLIFPFGLLARVNHFVIWRVLAIHWITNMWYLIVESMVMVRWFVPYIQRFSFSYLTSLMLASRRTNSHADPLNTKY